MLEEHEEAQEVFFEEQEEEHEGFLLEQEEDDEQAESEFIDGFEETEEFSVSDDPDEPADPVGIDTSTSPDWEILLFSTRTPGKLVTLIAEPLTPTISLS